MGVWGEWKNVWLRVWLSGGTLQEVAQVQQLSKPIDCC
jgi:hypothetical protein